MDVHRSVQRHAFSLFLSLYLTRIQTSVVKTGCHSKWSSTGSFLVRLPLKQVLLLHYLSRSCHNCLHSYFFDSPGVILYGKVSRTVTSDIDGYVLEPMFLDLHV